jgi:hypothetical protein
MGRYKKYETEQQQLDAKRRWRREWYARNKERVNKERMRKYYANQVGKNMP